MGVCLLPMFISVVLRRTSFVEHSTHLLVGPAVPFMQAFLLLSSADWSIVLHRTLAHLFGVPRQPPQDDSLLAIIKDSTARPNVWMPSLLPAGRAPLYIHSRTTYNHAAGTTTMRVQATVALKLFHV